METLEQLLNKSARLLKWHDFNQNDKTFQNYFNNHFYNIRTLGYMVCVQEVTTNNVEVYFRLLRDINYRTKGVILNDI